MVTAVNLAEDTKTHVATRTAKLLSVAGGVLVGLILGYMGWALPTPGGSLIIPTLVVAGVGLLVALAGGLFANRSRRQSLRIFSITVLILTVIASAWTFAVAMPASIVLDANANHQAEQLLATIKADPRTVKGVSPGRCWTVQRGRIGNLRAPYRECATSTPEGHFVIFTTFDQPRSGLTYTDRGAATFQDECSRHLVGTWWAYSENTNGLGSCPIGYQFHGGA